AGATASLAVGQQLVAELGQQTLQILLGPRAQLLLRAHRLLQHLLKRLDLPHQRPFRHAPVCNLLWKRRVLHVDLLQSSGPGSPGPSPLAVQTPAPGGHLPLANNWLRSWASRLSKSCSGRARNSCSEVTGCFSIS